MCIISSPLTKNPLPSPFLSQHYSFQFCSSWWITEYFSTSVMTNTHECYSIINQGQRRPVFFMEMTPHCKALLSTTPTQEKTALSISKHKDALHLLRCVQYLFHWKRLVARRMDEVSVCFTYTLSFYTVVSFPGRIVHGWFPLNLKQLLCHWSGYLGPCSSHPLFIIRSMKIKHWLNLWITSIFIRVWVKTRATL